ncbi:MAG: Gfo/Idh/MocA family oxidoreductase, partial [Kiritimatiellia bacterium]|nr:Gfo/Idh/MocA family oxidoreductase [Kiritimatiellia bacterium]
MPLSTPIDVRRGMTKSSDVSYPLRWGIIGTGSVSAQWVLSLRACEGATVTAVAARSAERATKFAGRYGIASAYGSYADMVASPDVDIVYVGTITRLHKEHTLLAIEAGKHVLCEKPLAENADDARAMYAAAADKKVMLQDGMWTRFFPAVEHARAAIEAGIIGNVVMVQSDFFDPIYTIQAAPLAFGAEAVPTAISAAGRKASGAIVAYGDERCAVLMFPPFNSELAEVTEIIGSKG